MYRNTRRSQPVPILCASALCAALLAACSDSPSAPTNPGQQGPTVASISPSSGPTVGGTSVTISGANFAGGATVTIGGTAATNVNVSSSTTITATTAEHPAGVGDVTVRIGDATGRLASGFTYLAPQASNNTPPRIASVFAQDQRRGTPRNFADLESLVDVTAFVADDETPLPELTYEWTAEAGTIDGSGPTARWRAPDSFATPGEVRLMVAVIERYETVNDQGLPSTAEHRVTDSVVVSLHDSEKELSDLGGEFLTDFSRQISPEAVVRNFSDGCRGKADELGDVQRNQRELTITDYSIGPPQVTISFGAVCQYLPSRGRHADGCALFPVRWRSTAKADGRVTNTNGVDQVTAIFDSGRWRLCDSDFEGTVTVNGKPTDIKFKK